MKILMISPNRETFVHRAAPVGILYLASALIQTGHRVNVLDLMFSLNLANDISSAIKEFQPDVTCIGIRNIDTLISKHDHIVPDIELTIATVKSHSNNPIILGGAGFSLVAEGLMGLLQVDLGIVGEADNSLPALIKALEDQSDYREIPGLIYREQDGKLKANPSDIVENLDNIPFQAVEFIDAWKYAKKRGYLGVFTRKACSQRCIYCAEAKINGSRVRLRSAKRVVDEIEHIIDKTGVVDFDFADTLFNVPRKHAMDICGEIIQRNMKFRFEVELNPIGQDDESVDLLKRAGCIGVNLTADSGSDRMLKTLRKGYTADQVYGVADLYHRYKIPYTVGFILGGPGEDLESLEESIQLAENCPKPGVVYFTVGIRVFEDTELARFMREQKLVSKVEDFCGLKFFLSDSFDDQCAHRLLKACNKRLNFYISDLIYGPSAKFCQIMSEIFNVRPVWKAGSIINIVERTRNFGRSPLYWDATARVFKCK